MDVLLGELVVRLKALDGVVGTAGTCSRPTIRQVPLLRLVRAD